VLRALREGTTTVTATSEGKSGTAQLLVTAPAPVATVTVLPSTDTLTVSDSVVNVAFFAGLADAQGDTLSNRVVTWAVGDSSVVQIVVTSGQWVWVRALRPGATLLIATSEGKSGSAHLAVR